MALAETARLIASLELQDKFSKNVAAYDKAVGGMAAKTASLDKLGNDIGRGVRNATGNLARIGAVGVGLLAGAVVNGVQELEKLESATAQTNAVIASTQGVAGETADSIRKLAEKYEGLNALIDDKVIQSGENVLLTFTNIRKEAFEPALQAALDLNTAMGGGEEGLQGTIIQVGKALQDPIRGLTALRRVGVNFTEQQKKQIKDLVSQNKLYEAQQIILGELTTEFGGSFAAAGDTAAGKFAKVRDAVDDAQAALATAFLPLLTKVADKLGTFLSDPATVQRIEDFGGQLAGGFEKILAVGGSLPWKEIGDAFKIVGTGSKALLDAFLGLPPWVQTAVLTGWGLNKLTGGALGSIVGDIGKLVGGGGLFGRGSSPANPLWVQSVGGGVGGPGGGAPVAGPLAGLIPTIATVAAGVAVGTIIAAPAFEGSVAPARKFEESQFSALTTRLDGSNQKLKDVNAAIAKLEAQQAGIGSNQIDLMAAGASTLVSFVTGQKSIGATLNDQLAQLRTQRDALQAVRASTADSARWQGLANSKLDTISSKNFSPSVNVNVSATTNVSVNPLQRTLTSARIAGSGTIGGFTESAF